MVNGRCGVGIERAAGRAGRLVQRTRDLRGARRELTRAQAAQQRHIVWGMFDFHAVDLPHTV